MQMPDLDFLGDKKGPVIAGGLGLVAVLALVQTMKKSDEGKQQTATLVPSEGVSWDQIIARRNSGVIGTVGPGEPLRGDDAYEIAKKNGFTGTLEEWLASLKGAAGAPGAPGSNAELTPQQKLALQWASLKQQKELTDVLDGALNPKPTPTPTPTPTKRPREISSAGKPYTCPAGYYMGEESTGSGHHVCIHESTGREIQVQYTARGGDVPSGRGSMGMSVPAPLRSQGSILVKPGDTFSSIATRAYGSKEYVPLLFFRNPGKRRLKVGETIRT